MCLTERGRNAALDAQHFSEGVLIAVRHLNSGNKFSFKLHRKRHNLMHNIIDGGVEMRLAEECCSTPVDAQHSL